MHRFSRYIVIVCLITYSLYPHYQEEIDTILNSQPTVNVGVEVYSLPSKEVIYEKNARTKFTPASNVKLITSLAALDILGPEYQFSTQLLVDGSLENESIVGNVYLKSDGDPSLTSADLEAMLNYLTDQGISSIVGNICIDRECFDTECFAPGTTIDDLGCSWLQPVNGLMVNGKGSEIDPLNHTTFIDNAKLQNLFFDIKLFISELLLKQGITLQGDIIYEKTPATSQVVTEHRSMPLSALLKLVNKESNNTYADVIFKKIAHITHGIPGTWRNGSKTIQFFLNSLDLYDFKICDGSGLSRYNLLSADFIIKLLSWAYEQNYYEQFLATLPIAGIDGTLKNRMQEINADVYAKTGSLGGVSCLSGYLHTEHHSFILSILINGYIAHPDYNIKHCVEDAICEKLSQLTEHNTLPI